MLLILGMAIAYSHELSCATFWMMFVYVKKWPLSSSRPGDKKISLVLFLFSFMKVIITCVVILHKIPWLLFIREEEIRS